MKKVGVYVRVSTAEQADKGWSVEGQYGEIRAFCEKHTDWKVAWIFKDAGATGKPAFRVGLGRIATGTRRKLIGDTYNFLSGYGSHPGGKPTRKDVEYGIRMAIASCSWVIESSKT